MCAAAFRIAALALCCVSCTTVAGNGGTFEGTHWRVAAISGRSAPNDGNYYVQFAGGRVSGRFGCNNWSGAYAINGETLTASQLAVTSMACIEPAAGFEARGLAVLNQPMQWKLIAGQQLNLNNGAGSIVLERQH